MRSRWGPRRSKRKIVAVVPKNEEGEAANEQEDLHPPRLNPYGAVADERPVAVEYRLTLPGENLEVLGPRPAPPFLRCGHARSPGREARHDWYGTISVLQGLAAYGPVYFGTLLLILRASVKLFEPRVPCPWPVFADSSPVSNILGVAMQFDGIAPDRSP